MSRLVLAVMSRLVLAVTMLNLKSNFQFFSLPSFLHTEMCEFEEKEKLM